jgi:hypothetical protein
VKEKEELKVLEREGERRGGTKSMEMRMAKKTKKKKQKNPQVARDYIDGVEIYHNKLLPKISIRTQPI